ncbi:hypothetical protein BH09PAT2_BH09PAT2_02850 [soil metagenome]
MKTAWEIKIDFAKKNIQLIASILLALLVFVVYVNVHKNSNKPFIPKMPFLWKVRSIETMSQTKDRLCSQPSNTFINDWVRLAKEANATHITYSGFYNSTPCGNADAYAARWEKAAHDAGLNIWWRQMFTEFEGIDKPVIPQCTSATRGVCNDYISLMVKHIKANKDKYQDGDIFSVTAEPAAGRIRGITCLGTGPCTFESSTGAANAIPEFNQWLLDSTQAAKNTFKEIGKDVTVNAGGFDLFVAVGYDNPDWGCDNNRKSILYHETVEKMGGFVMDHYFDPDIDTMQNAIDAINRCYPIDQYPNLKFQIGEWGPIYGPETTYYISTVMTTVANAGDRYADTFNYWQGGPFGQESLFAANGSTIQVTHNYDALKKEFTRKKNSQ